MTYGNMPCRAVPCDTVATSLYSTKFFTVSHCASRRYLFHCIVDAHIMLRCSADGDSRGQRAEGILILHISINRASATNSN